MTGTREPNAPKASREPSSAVPAHRFAWTSHGACSQCLPTGWRNCDCKSRDIPGCEYQIFIGRQDNAGDNLLIPNSRRFGRQPTSKTFFDLPAEVRTDIYELVFFDLDTSKDDVWWQPSLTLTSRRFRQEALPIYYSITHFTYHFGHSNNGNSAGDAEPLSQWLCAIGDLNVRNIHTVTLIARGVPPHQQRFKFNLVLKSDHARRITSHCETELPMRWRNNDRIEYFFDEASVHMAEDLVRTINGREWRLEILLGVVESFRTMKANVEFRFRRRE